MQFEARLRNGISDGRITLAFRRWRRPQAVTGHTYRTGAGMALAEDVSVVTTAEITEQDARDAGFATAAELVADLRGDPALPLYRIRFRPVTGPDPRDALAATADLTADDIAAIGARLARMDRASSRGPWTAEVLTAIAARPAVSSAILAPDLRWERADFKLHVRRLKALGLTISLDVGYRISPRGAAYLTAAGPGRPAR